MISFIVCSVNEKLRDALASNPERTVGVPYEIIAFDNREAALELTRVVYVQRSVCGDEDFFAFTEKNPDFCTLSGRATGELTEILKK